MKTSLCISDLGARTLLTVRLLVRGGTSTLLLTSASGRSCCDKEHIIGFLCNVIEVTRLWREAAGHIPQSSSQGSLTRASPRSTMVSCLVGKGWEIPLLERRGSGCFVVQLTDSVPFAEGCPWGKCQLLRSRQTPGPGLSGNSWQLTVKYQTWGHHIKESVFPSGRTLRWRFLPVYLEMTLQEPNSRGSLLKQWWLPQPGTNVDTMCPFSSQMTL